MSRKQFGNYAIGDMLDTITFWLEGILPDSDLDNLQEIADKLQSKEFNITEDK